ncbi:TPA: 50S ribosomal protein L6 [Candidatus Edwardsbacteria bacterium]|nr:50S ribosomal protein L6 [Candidatus Edwardsbacteria bacterium]
MSRVGKKPINLPQGVKAEIKAGSVKVTGPKGSIEQPFHPNIKVALEGDKLTVSRSSDDKFDRALHGLTRALLANAVTGVSQGFQKVLQVYGIGYKAVIEPKGLTLSLGYSHPVFLPKPDGIDFEIQDQPLLKVKDKTYQTSIVVKGINRQTVGEVAAAIRQFRKPEPYQGKGIRYQDEVVRRKAGKAAAGAGG